MAITYNIWASTYVDSVALMSIAGDIRALDGIDDSALVMATDGNKALLEQVAPLSVEVLAAKATDLILMMEGDEAQFDYALELVTARLTAKSGILSASTDAKPKSLRSALRTNPDATIALISVPGEYATSEAWKALDAGLDVLLFSDNVSIGDEKALKEYAVKQNLFVMGPGAGTAIINGVGLGFANKVASGNIGIVSASGTGLQEVSSLLSQLGSGVSQAIGVGGRDLKDDIGAIMTTQAIQALQSDDKTAVIVVISKLPSPAIAEKVIKQLANGQKPAVVIFMSMQSFAVSANVYLAETLESVAILAHTLATEGDVEASLQTYQRVLDSLEQFASHYESSQNTERSYVRGLFSGGTLCEEAIRIWTSYLGNVWSNTPLIADFKLANSSESIEHSAIDMGEEEFTLGRPHPMIDTHLRLQRLQQEAANPMVRIIQMDIVLGYGAHPNPASEFCPVIKSILEQAGQEIIIIVSIVGTQNDPQNLAQQQEMFRNAGAIVMDSNARASTLTARIARIPADV